MTQILLLLLLLFKYQHCGLLVAPVSGQWVSFVFLMSHSTAFHPGLSSKDIEEAAELFHVTSTDTVTVTGQQAASLFAQSNLPPETLAQIWDIADEKNLGGLDRRGFSIALKLIACAQKGLSPSLEVLSSNIPLPMLRPTSHLPLVQDSMTLEERSKYLHIFSALEPERKTISMDKVRPVFMRSKLPEETIEAIGQLVHKNRSNEMTKTEFILAMHYIERCMEGLQQLPDAIPFTIAALAQNKPPPPKRRERAPPIPKPSIQQASVGASVGASVTWSIDAEEELYYKSLFDAMDTQYNGYLSGNEVAHYFKNSSLSDTQLALIWDLADTQNKGYLSFKEFIIAAHIAKVCEGGCAVPSLLPESLTASIDALERSRKTKGSPLSPASDSRFSQKTSPVAVETLLEETRTRTTELLKREQSTKTAFEHLQYQKTQAEEALIEAQEQEKTALRRIDTLEKDCSRLKAEIQRILQAQDQQDGKTRAAQKHLATVTETHEALKAQSAFVQEPTRLQEKKAMASPQKALSPPPPPPPKSRLHRTQSALDTSPKAQGSKKKPPAPPAVVMKKKGSPGSIVNDIFLASDGSSFSATQSLSEPDVASTSIASVTTALVASTPFVLLEKDSKEQQEDVSFKATTDTLSAITQDSRDLNVSESTENGAQKVERINTRSSQDTTLMAAEGLELEDTLKKSENSTLDKQQAIHVLPTYEESVNEHKSILLESVNREPLKQDSIDIVKENTMDISHTQEQEASTETAMSSESSDASPLEQEDSVSAHTPITAPITDPESESVGKDPNEEDPSTDVEIHQHNKQAEVSEPSVETEKEDVSTKDAHRLSEQPTKENEIQTQDIDSLSTFQINTLVENHSHPSMSNVQPPPETSFEEAKETSLVTKLPASSEQEYKEAYRDISLEEYGYPTLLPPSTPQTTSQTTLHSPLNKIGPSPSTTEHDFEVVDNASIASSFASASMGEAPSHSDSVDEFDFMSSVVTNDPASVLTTATESSAMKTADNSIFLGKSRESMNSNTTISETSQYHGGVDTLEALPVNENSLPNVSDTTANTNELAISASASATTTTHTSLGYVGASRSPLSDAISPKEEASSFSSDEKHEHVTIASSDSTLPAKESDSINVLTGMGFTVDQAKDALRQYDNDLQKATNFLLDQF
ncbi:hypothetical protein BDF14DRAFT_1853914 [Spinellus fusiger]|nr:hypothetical protein BDF14DRAFT_1853914 [Spinellus fusiger]